MLCVLLIRTKEEVICRKKPNLRVRLFLSFATFLAALAFLLLLRFESLNDGWRR